MRLPVRWLSLLGVGAVLAACSGGKEAVKGDQQAAGADRERLAENIRRGQAGNEKVTEYDLNRDQKPDVWAYTVPWKDAEGREIDKLVRKELDINGDGKVDITRYYDGQEQVQRETLDLDFDGKVDSVNLYEKGAITRKERDLDSNGKSDVWVYFEKGKIVRKERDINSDGKVDYWEYWEDDQVDRIGEDLDGDGSVDRWTRNPETAAP